MFVLRNENKTALIKSKALDADQRIITLALKSENNVTKNFGFRSN